MKSLKLSRKKTSQIGGIKSPTKWTEYSATLVFVHCCLTVLYIKGMYDFAFMAKANAFKSNSLF